MNGRAFAPARRGPAQILILHVVVGLRWLPRSHWSPARELYATPHPDEVQKHAEDKPHARHDRSLHSYLEEAANSPGENRAQIAHYRSAEQGAGEGEEEKEEVGAT